MAKIQSDIEIELSRQHSSESQAMLKAEIAAIQHRLNLLGQAQPFDDGSEPDEGQEMPPSGMNQQPTGGQSPGNYMGDNHE